MDWMALWMSFPSFAQVFKTVVVAASSSFCNQKIIGKFRKSSAMPC